MACRDATATVVGRAQQLVSILRRKGPQTPFNMDWTLLHVAADVIGEVPPANLVIFFYFKLRSQRSTPSLLTN